jgi:hypothetical protein
MVAKAVGRKFVQLTVAFSRQNPPILHICIEYKEQMKMTTTKNYGTHQ